MEKRPTLATIDSKALGHNYLAIRERTVGRAVLAVVKANAYGHGDVEVARLLERLGCDFLGVALVEEGIRLRKANIKKPIVVLGGAYSGQIEQFFLHDLTPVVFDLKTAGLIDMFAKDLGQTKHIHVKIDTGMTRLGLVPEEALRFASEVKTMAHLKVESIVTHLSEAESPQSGFSAKQTSAFSKTLDIIKGAGLDFKYASIANSAGSLEPADERLNLIRPGIMLYGSYPSEALRQKINLKPVMTLKTRITLIKEVPANTPVSYGRTYVTERPSRIAVLPAGYADGVPRRISNNGSVLIRGQRAPIAGRVCMDLTMCDVTDVPGAQVNDEVVFFGTQGNSSITVEEVAESIGSISYEVFCNVSSRVPRYVI